MAARYALVLGLSVMGLPAWAVEWPQFRGPGGSAVSTETGLPAEWGADQNVAWKAKLPGYGWSCPVVWGDKVFVTTAVSDKQTKPSGNFGPPGMFPGPGDRGPGPGPGFPGPGPGFPGGRPPDAVYRWQVYCLSAADGSVLWKQTAAEQKPTVAIQAANTYATETPATDGERVYAYFGTVGVFCYDLDGKPLWKADLGAYRAEFGAASSPVLDDGRLFIQCDNDEKSFLVALDAKTGQELWKVGRTDRTSWSTPLIWKNKARTEIVCLGGSKARSYDPATGKQLWELGGMGGRATASMTASDDLLYLGTDGGPGGGNRPLFAVRAGASGDITLRGDATSNDGVAWFQPQAGPATASPLLYDGCLYILDQQGSRLYCYDAKTGERVYRERLSGATGFTSSPWAYEGKVFCLDSDGRTYVVKAGPEFKLLGQNDLDAMCWSSPAVSGGALFLRTVDDLYCIRDKNRGAGK